MDSVTQQTIPGGWTERAVTVAGRTFSLVLPAAPVDFLELVTDDALDDREHLEPYWAELWPASVALAEIVLRSAWPPGKKILEIGCGVGLVGLAALSLGLDVTLTDNVPLAVAVAAENVHRNGLAERACVRRLDWRDPPTDRFSAVLGSDVLYDQRHHAPILALLRGTCDEAGFAWLADPGRSAAAPFVRQANAAGFVTRLTDQGGRELPEPHSQFQRLELRLPQ